MALLGTLTINVAKEIGTDLVGDCETSFFLCCCAASKRNKDQLGMRTGRVLEV